MPLIINKIILASGIVFIFLIVFYVGISILRKTDKHLIDFVKLFFILIFIVHGAKYFANYTVWKYRLKKVETVVCPTNSKLRFLTNNYRCSDTECTLEVRVNYPILNFNNFLIIQGEKGVVYEPASNFDVIDNQLVDKLILRFNN